MNPRPAFRLAARWLPACALLAILVAPAGVAGQTVTLNRAGKNVNIVVGDAAALPADFPPDVPLPVPHAVVRVERSDGSTTVTMTAPGAVDDEAARFRAGMLAAGWSAAPIVAPPTGQGQAWTKAGRAVVAWLTPVDAGGIRVQLQLMAAKGTSAPATP